MLFLALKLDLDISCIDNTLWLKHNRKIILVKGADVHPTPGTFKTTSNQQTTLTHSQKM